MSSSGMSSSRVDVVPMFGGPSPASGDQVADEPPQETVSSTDPAVPAWVVAGRSQSSGPLRLIWWLYVRLALYKFDWIPQPPSIMSYRSASAELTGKINDLRRYSMAIVAVMTSKGGATKTTVSTWLSAFLASTNHKSVAIFDVDRGGGKVANRFGFKPKEVMTTDSFATRILNGAAFDHSMLTTMTESDSLTGVTVFHALPGQSISAEKMKTVLGKLKTQLHTLVIDTGPGFRVPASNAAAVVSTVQVLVGNGNSDDDLGDIAATLAHVPYQLADSYEETDSGTTARRVHDSVIIAISGLSRSKCNTRTQYAFAERYGVTPDQIVLIPFNPYLRRTGRVRLMALEPRTAYAFHQLAYQVARVAARTNRRADPYGL